MRSGRNFLKLFNNSWNQNKKRWYLISTLNWRKYKYFNLEIFPGSSTLENEIQKYDQIRDFGLYRHFQVLQHQKGSPFQKLLDLEMPVMSSVHYLNYNVNDHLYVIQYSTLWNELKLKTNDLHLFINVLSCAWAIFLAYKHAHINTKIWRQKIWKLITIK